MRTIEKPKAKGTATTEQRPRISETERVEKWVAWLKVHQRRLAIVGGALVVVAGGVWFAVTAKGRREAFAQRELAQARFSAESGNLPLAANDLSRIVSTYGGTRAGQEATLLLAQVRLLQGQAELAVTELQAFLEQRPHAQYQAPGFAALGAALEEMGSYAAAATAYRDAAEASAYELVAARFLMDAGRAYTLAGDTASAASAYQRILSEHEGSPAAAEATLRLAELGRYDVPQGS